VSEARSIVTEKVGNELVQAVNCRQSSKGKDKKSRKVFLDEVMIKRTEFLERACCS
jgi:hypothetical protein